DWGNPPIPPNARAQYQNFANGTVYWSPTFGAHFLSGKIREKYQALVSQGNVNLIGYPARDIQSMGSGKVLYLRNESHGSAIYWDGDSGHPAHLVAGEIATKYSLLGEVVGDLGFPTTDTQPTYDGQGQADGGKFNLFQNGAIYMRDGLPGMNDSQKALYALRPSYLHGPVYQVWFAGGATRSYLGFPVSD